MAFLVYSLLPMAFIRGKELLLISVMSVGFEYSGKLTQPTGEVKVTIPAALLILCRKYTALRMASRYRS